MMTETERAEWLNIRKTGIGGSEIGSLLSHEIPEVKYGCRRNLWYSKSKRDPDFEKEETAPMRLGQLMEGPICDLYAQLTGRRIEEVGRMVHPQYPELGVSLDRLVYAKERPDPGIIEAKCPGMRNFYSAKREGPPIEYLCQANHGMLVAGAALGIDINWAVMIFGRSDDPKMIARALDWHMKVKLSDEVNPSYILYWEIEKDQKVCDAILREGPAFWKTIGKEELIPDRLPEPEDPRCGRCEFRMTCRGNFVTPESGKSDIPIAEELAPLAVEYLERKTLADEAEELVAETKEVVMAILGNRQAVQVPVAGKLRPLYWRPEDGAPLYKEAVTGLSAQYNQMRDALVKIETAAKATGDDRIAQLAAGAELIPPPSSFLRKGKQKRPLKMQFLNPAPKKGGE